MLRRVSLFAVLVLALPARGAAAIADQVTFCTAQVKTSSTSWVFTTSADLTSGQIGFILISTDNTNAVADGNANEHTALTDAAGNHWVKIGEYTNAGTAAANATVSVWMTKATTTLTSGSNVTLTLGTARTAKAATCEKFSVDSGKILIPVAKGDLSNDAADAGSITLSNLANVEHLFLRATGHEGPNTDSYTASTNYTAMTHTSSGTTGSTAGTNMSVRGEYRILTGTSDSTDPAYTAVNHASTMIALTEASPSTAIAVDGMASSSCTGCTSLTFSHTVIDNTNGLLVVQMRSQDGTLADRTATGATYNGVAMTNVTGAIVETVAGANQRIQRFTLVAPATGAHNVVITMTGGGNCNFLAGDSISLTGVDQTNPVDVNATATANSTGPTASITTTADLSFIISAMIYNRGNDFTFVDTTGGLQISRAFDGTAAQETVDSYRGAISPAGATTFTYSQNAVGADVWGISLTSLKPASASGNQVGDVSVTLSPSQSVAISAGRFGLPSESLTTSPSIAAVAALNAGVSESLTTSPSVVASNGKLGSVSETLSPSYSVSALAGFVKGVSESLTTSASPAANPGRSPVVVEDHTTTATVATLGDFLAGVSESLTASASVSAQQSGASSRAVSETLSPTQTATAKADLHASVTQNLTTVAAVVCVNCIGPLTETLTTVDLVSVLKNSGQVFTRNPSETLLVIPSVAALATHSGPVAETLSTTASVATQANKNATVAETLTASSAVAIGGVFARSAAEGLLISDSASAFLTSPNARGVAETLGHFDVAAAKADHALGVDETATVSQSVAVNLGLRLTMTETLVAQDAVGIQVVRAGGQRKRIVLVESP